MNKNIKNADLLAINPKEIDQEIKIEIVFSEVARWAPKELLKLVITVPEWLEFLENCFIQFNKPEHIVSTASLSVEHQKSQVKFIGTDMYAFSVLKTKWKRFIEVEAEKLLLSGVVTI